MLDRLNVLQYRFLQAGGSGSGLLDGKLFFDSYRHAVTCIGMASAFCQASQYDQMKHSSALGKPARPI